MASDASNLHFSSGAVCEPPSDTAVALARSLEKMKTLYQADQQTKFLNLQAETETLLQRLQALKQQRTSDEFASVDEISCDRSRSGSGAILTTALGRD